MSGDMKEAFRKAGHKGVQPQPAKSQMRETYHAGRAGYNGGQPQPARAQATAAKFVLKDDYTSQADQVIQELKASMGRNYQQFTTSKIRNILAMVSEIYNDVVAGHDDVLSPALQSRIEYLKVRLVYECGREPYVVKPFVDKSGLLELLHSMGDSRENFIKFSRYMEALVAYHRFYGGHDN